jgi:hypothetical protein
VFYSVEIYFPLSTDLNYREKFFIMYFVIKLRRALKLDSAPPRGSAWKPALEQGERRDAKRESLANRTHERLWEWWWYQRCLAGL